MFEILMNHTKISNTFSFKKFLKFEINTKIIQQPTTFKHAPIKMSVNLALNDLVQINSAAVTTPVATALGDALLTNASSPDFWPFQIASQTAGWTTVTILRDFSITDSANVFKL
jgi:hypothetical protein